MAKRPRGELRTAILDATVDLLRRHQDPELVSIEAVVTAVGCTPPSVYYYFPTKADLLLQACRREYEAFAADLESATSHSSDALGDLRMRGAAYLAWARANPATYRLLFMTPLALADPIGDRAGPGHIPDLREVPGLSQLVADLERAAAAGHPIGDPELAAFVLWGVVHGFACLSITEPGIPAEFLLAGMQRAAEGVLRPPAG